MAINPHEFGSVNANKLNPVITMGLGQPIQSTTFKGPNKPWTFFTSLWSGGNGDDGSNNNGGSGGNGANGGNGGKGGNDGEGEE